MPRLLEGKLALVTGIANRWSLAYSIAQAFAREGATLVLTYLGERQKVDDEIHDRRGNMRTPHDADAANLHLAGDRFRYGGGEPPGLDPEDDAIVGDEDRVGLAHEQR